MSRAFVKEDRADTEPLPDLPISPHPNFVTDRGLKALQDRLAAAQSELARLRARADRLDLMPEKAAERDIRYLSARLASALPTRAPDGGGEVAFGHRVTVADDDGHETTYEIVGEDEADAPRHLIAPHSPLARALLGARVGDVVEWRRPAGALSLEIRRIAPI